MTDEIQGLTEDNSFSCDGYQVVRSEFLSRTNMPAICFDGVRLSVNAACLRKMPDVRFVQFLVNPYERKLALRSCGEDDKDSFLWCTVKDGKRTPRKIICRLFTAKLIDLMNWGADKKYRITGTFIKTNSERLMLFELNSAEVSYRSEKRNETVVRQSCFSEQWQDNFGSTFEEHERSISINLFNDYTVFVLNG